MRNDEKIKTIKQELLEKYNIKTDRDLIQQLGIQDEDKSKLFAWIRYQCAFSYREGFDNGQDELKEQLVLQSAVEISKDVIKLNQAETGSGLTRVKWAEGLIKQLPRHHEGRNSWLRNYGTDEESEGMRKDSNSKWHEETQSAELIGKFN